MKLVLLHSDNHQHALMTPEAYAEVRLQMSTGDFATHKAVKFIPRQADLIIFNAAEPVYELDSETGELYSVSSIGYWIVLAEQGLGNVIHMRDFEQLRATGNAIVSASKLLRFARK
jgi:hypothetical protein